jgi:probable addiction module antidote protein
MTEKTTPFDIAAHLETDSDILGFLSEVAKEGDSSDLLHALSVASRAKGMTNIAKQAGVNRQSLYRSLSEEGAPKFETIMKVIEALGLRIDFQVQEQPEKAA